MDVAQEKIQVLNGCMLGDGFVHKSGRFRLKMSSKNEDYVDEVREILLEDAKKLTRFDKPGLKKIDGIVCEDSSKRSYLSEFYTCTNDFYKCLRNKWYRGSKKIIPEDLVLTDLSVAHWYVQDGTNVKSQRSCYLYTNSFSKSEVEFLVELLSSIGFKGLSINWQNKQPVIRIGSKGYFELIDRTRPFIKSISFNYKFEPGKYKKGRSRKHDSL